MLGDNTLNSADACHNDSLHLFVTILTIFSSFYHNPTVLFIRIKKNLYSHFNVCVLQHKQHKNTDHRTLRNFFSKKGSTA